jgi:hypothetical protein
MDVNHIASYILKESPIGLSQQQRTDENLHHHCAISGKLPQLRAAEELSVGASVGLLSF